MDKSLDELIKENPRKFGINKNRQQRRNTSSNKANKNNGTKKNKLTPQNTKNKQFKMGINKGRVTKSGKVAGRQGKKVVGNFKAKPNLKRTPNKMVDARNKLLSKNRQKITDARDRLADIARKGDLREKLATKRPVVLKKALVTKAKPMQIHNLARDIGRNPITRTILSRTVDNELARPMRSINLSGAGRHDLISPHYLDYIEPTSSIGAKRSSAAMDCEPSPPILKRIRVTDKRLGMREENSPHAEYGHCVYVDNLHPKVTQEDIIELFGDIGTLVKASLQQPGRAEVVYVHHEDALRAVEVYHNRQLDGLPMRCALAPVFDTRRDNEVYPKPRPLSDHTARLSRSGKPNIAPDISTIHKALFNKTSSNSQIFTVTLPKKDI